MKNKKAFVVRSFVSLLILCFMSFGAQAFSIGGSSPASLAPLVEKVSPAVVNINTTKNVAGTRRYRGVDPFFEQFFNDYMNRQYPQGRPERQQNSLGTGFIYEASGKVLTNYHVVAGADEVFVSFADGKNLPAKILGADEKLDLAVLQIQKREKYPAVELGDSDGARVGDWVMAVGNPFGLGQTVTAGIISAKGRVLGGAYDNFIQTDASINPGNSGGPLFDMEGRVVGINSAIIASAQGIGFAIPINIVKAVANQLATKGAVTRGWLGATIRESGNDPTRPQLATEQGALVIDLAPQGPAMRAGLRVGDLIIKVDNQNIQSGQELPRLVASHKPGEKITLTVQRERQTKNIEVVLGDLDNPDKLFSYALDKEESKQKPQQNEIGIDVRDIESSDSLLGQKGVLITKVRPESPAQAFGLERGDIITELNGVVVKNVQDFKARMTSLSGQNIIKLKIRRGDAQIIVAFRR